MKTKNRTEFILKPTRNRIIWSLIVFSFSIFLISTLFTYFYDLNFPITLNIAYWLFIWPAILFGVLVSSLHMQNVFLEIWITFVGGIVVEAIYSYLLVCFISWTIKRFQSSNKVNK